MLIVFSFLFMGLYILYLLSRVGRSASLKTTPLAFGVQLAFILFLLFSKIYFPEDPPKDQWERFDRILGVVLILGLSANLVWMYFRLFYRYEQLAAFQQQPNVGSNPEP